VCVCVCVCGLRALETQNVRFSHPGVGVNSSYDVIARSLVAEKEGIWTEELPNLQVLHSNGSFGDYGTVQATEIVFSANSANTVQYYPGGGLSPGAVEPLPVSRTMLTNSQTLYDKCVCSLLCASAPTVCF
jgi:hypothetical protein